MATGIKNLFIDPAIAAQACPQIGSWTEIRQRMKELVGALSLVVLRIEMADRISPAVSALNHPGLITEQQ